MIARDDRLGDAGDRGERRLERAGALDHVDVRHVGHLLDVGAGGEDPLAAVDDHRLDVVALARLGRGGADLLLDLHVEGVHLRPVEPDGADTVLDLEPHELRHGCPRLVWRVSTGIDAERATVDNVAGDPRNLAPTRRDRAGVARAHLAARRVVRRGGHELRGAGARGHRGCGSASSTTRAARRGTQLTEVSLGIWHGAIPGVAPGTRYGYRADGPWAAGAWGCGSTRRSCCSTRTRGRSAASWSTTPRSSATTSAHPPGRSRLDSAAYVPKGVVVARPRLRLGRRPPPVHPVARHRDLRAARQGDDRAPRPRARAPAWHVRRVGHARGDRLPARPRRDRGRAAAGAAVRQRAAGDAARDGQLLGLQHDRVLRSAPRLLVVRRPRRAGARVQGDGEGVPRGGARGDPRRRLQPHRRGLDGRSDPVVPRVRRPRLLPPRRPAPRG